MMIQNNYSRGIHDMLHDLESVIESQNIATFFNFVSVLIYLFHLYF